MLHTGKHDDYHRPSDDTHLLNLDGIRNVSQFMLRCTVAAANAETLPSIRNWSKEKSAAFAQVFHRPLENQPSRLGVTYNATLAKEGTIRLTSIASGSPANLAGLQIDDEVLAVGGKTTSDSRDFRALVMSAPTETAFEIRRSETKLTIPVKLRGNPVLFGFRWIMDGAEPGSAIVTHLADDSLAAAAGLKPQHRIRNVNGETFASRSEFQDLLIDAKNPINLEVEFNGKYSTLTIDSSNSASEESTSSSDSEQENLDKK
jgi:S1-C subfamily serine protease